jgi:type I restriction enzyme, S subunit
LVAEPLGGPKAGTLPHGWRTVTFGQLARNVDVQARNPLDTGIERYVGLDHLEPGNLHIRNWGNVADGTTFTRRFKPGQVLFGKRRAYQRKAAVAEFDGICSGDILVFEPSGDDLLPELLPFIVESDGFFDHALRTSAGSLSPRTKWKELAEYTLLLPPKEEQRRIANVLWAADAAMERWREVVAAAADARQVFIDDQFSPSQDAQREPLGKFCTLQVGFPFKSAEFSSAGDRLVRGSNVAVGRLRWESEATRYWPAPRREEFADYVLVEGDIVVAMDRPFVSEGFKVARVVAEDLPALLLQRVGRFQPSDGLVVGYLWAAIHSRAFRDHLLANQQGTDLPHVSRFDVESALLPIPCAAEQETLSRLFDAAWSSEQRAREQLGAAIELRKALLVHLLQGSADV